MINNINNNININIISKIEYENISNPPPCLPRCGVCGFGHLSVFLFVLGTFTNIYVDCGKEDRLHSGKPRWVTIRTPPKPPARFQRGIDSVGPPHPGGLLDASQRPQTPLRRLKTPPNGPQMPQEASKTPQEASKRPQEAPRLPQDVQNPSKMELSWHQNRIQNRS